jgi:hypothetical protein
MALVFWSKLVQANTYSCQCQTTTHQATKSNKTKLRMRLERNSGIPKNNDGMNTVSQIQEGGTQGRPPAPHKFERHTTKQLLGSRIIVPWITQWPYWRVVNT